MKGIVLISHGELAKGMAHSATFFMGDSIQQLEYCCLEQDTSPDKYAEELAGAIERVDSGEGVVILADLFGGTPCNRAAMGLNDRTELIAGMNFPLLLELLTARMGAAVDTAALAESGRSAICDVKALLATQTSDDEDDVS